jgi:hypothetical protein
VNGHSSTLLRHLSSVRGEVAGPLRRAIPWALLAALAAAVIAGAVTAAVATAQPKRFAAAATFDVITRPPDEDALSRNRGLIAEQVSRALRDGRAEDLAATAAPRDEFSGEWVQGPGFGEISYRVESSDRKVAEAAAQAVYDQAGFLGSRLVKPGQEWPSIDLVEVTAAAPTRPAVTRTIAAGTALGAVTGFALVLLFAVPIRRPEPVADPAPA